MNRGYTRNEGGGNTDVKPFWYEKPRFIRDFRYGLKLQIQLDLSLHS